MLSEENKDYLIKNFCIKSIKEIAKELKIDEKLLALEARSLNLKKRNFKKFTDEEVDIIKNHSKYLTYSDLSHLLKRNRSVIFNKVKELGIEKDENQVEIYKEAINGFEDSIMFMHTNLKYSNEQIKEVIDKNCQNQLNIEMINSFIIFNKDCYKSRWKLFGMEV
jgi:hypothetical protein